MRKPRKTKAERQRDAAIEKAYYLAFNGVPVMGLKIPEIWRKIGEAVDETVATGKGAVLAERLKGLVAEYRAD